MKGRHRAEPNAGVAGGWLGAGAVTLGVGAALAGGSGIAHADSTGPGHSSGVASSSSATGSESRPRPSSSAEHISRGPSASSHEVGGMHTAPKTKRSPANTPTHGSSTTSTPTHGVTPPDPTHGVTPPDPTHGVTPPDPPQRVGRALTHLVHHVVADAVAEARGVVEAAVPKARSAAALAPHLALSNPTVGKPAVPHTPAAVVTPAAAAPVAPPLPADPIVGLVGEVLSVVNTLVTPNPAAPLANPLQLAVFEVVRRIEIKFGLPVAGAAAVATPDPVIGSNPVSAAPGVPGPADVVDTAFGDIGKWLLQPGGQISDFGGERLDGKTLLEPINVIIVDPSSTTGAEATAKLDADLGLAGFPAQPVHSTGFQGIVGGQTFGQQPTGFLEAFSDNLFVLPDDHARAFGPAPVPDGTGFVSTIAASREQFGFNGLVPAHQLVSYDAARDELAAGLIRNGATLVGIIALSNAVDSATETTGDHDGYAIVIRLND